jgi:hypothetical protein
MSGGGRFCRVIRHIADHFWINTADYVMAERNLPPTTKIRLYRGKSRESETSPLYKFSVLLNTFQHCPYFLSKQWAHIVSIPTFKRKKYLWLPKYLTCDQIFGIGSQLATKN